MSERHQLVRLATLIVGFGLLSGCLSEVNIRPTLTADTVVPPQHGVLVARFINAGPNPLPFNQLTIAPQNLNQSAQIKPERLIAITKHDDGSAVFVSTVEPGSYALNSFRSFHVLAQATYSRFVGVDATFGTFQIEPGKVTDLGTIVFYPKPSGDKFEETLVRIPDTATGEVLDTHAAFHRYDRNSMLSWDEDGFDADRQASYLSILQNPVKFETNYKTPDGSMLFLAPLGVILERDSSGNWSTDALDSNLQMHAVAQNDAGDRAVGGSEGQIFFRPVNGQWQDISLEKNLHVDALEYTPSGTLVAVVREETAVIIKARAANGVWNDINQFVATRDWYKKEPLKGFEASLPKSAQRIFSLQLNDFEGKRYLFLSLQPMSAPPSAIPREFAFEYHPETYVTRRVNKPYDVISGAGAGAVRIGRKANRYFGLEGPARYYRRDAEDGWVEMANYVRFCGNTPTTSQVCRGADAGKTSRRRTLSFVATPWFKDDNQGIAVADLDFTGWRESDPDRTIGLFVTADGGQSWLPSEHTLPQEYCTHLVADVADRMLLSCNGANGDFYESFDDGASWSQVREHQNF